MYRLKTADLLKKRFIALWSLLAFQAGFINSIGFLACQRYVSHVTGFGTQLGIALGAQNFWLAIDIATGFFSFGLGACLCGLLTGARKARGLRPRYEVATLSIPVLLLILLVCGNFDVFGPFGQPAIFEEDFFFLSILSFICGVQNAAFSILTEGQVRTTHLTGLVTDFGTDLALVWNGQLPLAKHSELKLKNVKRAMIFGSFTIGALVSSIVTVRLHYWSLIIPFVSALFVNLIFFIVKYEIDHSDRNSMDKVNEVPIRARGSIKV